MSDFFQTGAVARTATLDEGSVNPDDHLLRGLSKCSILRDFLPNLFVDALPNRHHAASRGGVIRSARWRQ